MLHDIDIEDMGRGIKKALRNQVKIALEHEHVGEYPDLRPRTPEEVDEELAAFDQRADAAEPVDVARLVIDEFVLARAADTVEEEFADQPLVQAELHDALGSTYKALGLYDVAEPHLRTTLGIRRSELGDVHEQVAASMNNLGVLLQLNGDFDEAESLHRDALTMYRSLAGNSHVGVAFGLNELAELLRTKGDYGAAEPLYRDAIEIRLDVGEENVELATCLNNLALCLQSKGDLDAAEPLAIQALDLRRNLHGDVHRHVAASLNNLALLKKANRDYEGAELLYREAMDMERKLSGDMHPIIAERLNNLARLLSARGDDAAAEPLLSEALMICRNGYSREHPVTAMILHHLGDVVYKLGRDVEAEELVKESLAMYRAHPEWRSGEHRHALTILGELYVSLGQNEKAARLLRESVAVRRRLPPGSSALARSLLGPALHYGRIEHYDESEELLREILAIFQQAYPDGHAHAWYASQVMARIGRVLTRQAVAIDDDRDRSLVLFEEAERLLLTGHSGLREARAVFSSTDRERDALVWLVELYESWDALAPESGKAAQADTWRAELDKLPEP